MPVESDPVDNDIEDTFVLKYEYKIRNNVVGRVLLLEVVP